MKKLILTLIIISCVFAQTKETGTPRISGSIGVGLLGNHPILTSEFEYYFEAQEKGQFSMNVRFEGFGQYFAPSIGMNYSMGQKHQFLTGINLAAMHMYIHGTVYDFWDNSPALSPKLGYRFNFGKDTHKFFIQSCYSPIILFGFDPLGISFISNVRIGFGLYF